MNLGLLLVVGLLATLPIGLYNFWVRHSDWSRERKYHRTFAAVATASGMVVFGETVGIRLPAWLELGVLGLAWVSLALWIYFGAKARRNQTG